MNSIGNDIVDLNFIDKARTETKRFYSKILSESEQQFYQSHFNSIPLWQYVWLLWSCKESVYKFAKRLQPELVFSPVKIILQSELTEFKNFQNTLFVLKFVDQGNQYYVSSLITNNYITTIANDSPDFSDIKSDVIQIDDSDYGYQSAAVRKYFLKELNTLYPNQTFEIVKSEVGYPVIRNNDTDSGIIASFSHHGNYVAYAFKKL